MSVLEIASAFVQVVLLRREEDVAEELSLEEVDAILQVLAAAGFGVVEIKLGKLTDHYRKQDGSSSGRTYVVNGTCPFKVVGTSLADDYAATLWLNSAWASVLLKSHGVKKSHEQLALAFAQQIEQSRPLEPIQLTPMGDYLREYPPQGNAVDTKHTRDADKLGSCIGIHDFCNGWMDRRGATRTHDAINCRACNLRVLFPKEVTTYGELRAALSPKTSVL